MGILQSGGALEHYALLQEEAGRAEADAEGLRQRLKTSEEIESTKTELDIERARLLKTLQDDHHERESLIEEAILVLGPLERSLRESRKPHDQRNHQRPPSRCSSRRAAQ